MLEAPQEVLIVAVELVVAVIQQWEVEMFQLVEVEVL